MRVLSRVLAGLGLTAALIVPAAASAHSHHRFGFRHRGGDVYVNDNTASANTVAAFHRAPDGRLIPLPGSPFATGGAGTGTALGSQGALQSALHGRYLLAVDAGSNQISVLAVGRHGSPYPVPGGTVASGGVQPVSIAVHGNLVYVANAGGTSPNYTGFRLGFGGRLRPLPGSTVDLPQGSQPGDVLFNATGTKLAGTRVATSLIDSFVVGPFGRLHAAPGSPYAAQGPGPFGSEFRPTDPNELYVSNAHGGAGNGTVSAFRVRFNGTLSSIGDSPFADDQTAPCWVEISHDGRFLFTVNTAQPSISSFAIDGDGSLTLLGSTQFRGNPSGLSPFDARLSPDGHTLYVVDSGTGQVSAFAVHGGRLAELPSSPTALPAGATPFGIVVS
ncbi:MAG TPA: beta-propeller fold lactonase family protein [Solirubrobacteraceae bacterium]|jgi:6-phosphogluconolactonase|nr:beta-propeller fold lactonase family protein [Solirubrobacteraceae bacterium]